MASPSYPKWDEETLEKFKLFDFQKEYVAEFPKFNYSDVIEPYRNRHRNRNYATVANESRETERERESMRELIHRYEQMIVQQQMMSVEPPIKIWGQKPLRKPVEPMFSEEDLKI